ncbi:MAG: M24 family metallopeptidase, partial [Saprospiraceae bacterium]
PHGLGHALGLDVHDMEGLGEQYVGYQPGLERSKQFGLKSLRFARTLEPGFVLTVEPGIYFIPQLIDIWQKEGRAKDFIRYDKLEAFRDFTGIRIEDNIVVTEAGCQVLGMGIPKQLEEIEAIRIGG